jgi:multidrug efflux pump subunit AcrA (membrane-fusion protein)
MKKISVLLLILVVLIGVSACGTTKSTATPTVAAPVVNTVTASGNLFPNQTMYLTFLVRAKVAAIPVKVGDDVKQGDVLMTLGDTAQADAALATANAELLSAQQDYDSLLRTADLGQAQAWLAWMNAQEARQVAERAWENLDLDAIDKDIDDANATVADRQTDLDDAQENFDKYKNLANDNTTRIEYEDDLTLAQNDYNEAVREVEELTANRDSVKAQLDLTMAAEKEALHSYQNTLNGADVDKLSLAKARLDAATSGVAAAQAALDNYTLTAPFDGTVVEVNLLKNEFAGPEKIAVLIADYSSWYVDTSDLSELDIMNVKQGQAVTFTADALPGIVMKGTVDRISGDPKNQINDVLYTAHILVEDHDPQIKWGMTVEVTFPIE